MSSGYRPCGCRDCFEIAIGPAFTQNENFEGYQAEYFDPPTLCHACKTADCDPSGDCQAQIELADAVDQHCDDLAREHNILCKCEKCIADITGPDPRRF